MKKLKKLVESIKEGKYELFVDDKDGKTLRNIQDRRGR